MQNSKTFINENNKEVTFGVGASGELVKLSAESSDSSAEWEVTRKEAEELHKMLGEYLKQPKKMSAEYYHG
jgi:hypothetical protein